MHNTGFCFQNSRCQVRVSKDGFRCLRQAARLKRPVQHSVTVLSRLRVPRATVWLNGMFLSFTALSGSQEALVSAKTRSTLTLDMETAETTSRNRLETVCVV